LSVFNAVTLTPALSRCCSIVKSTRKAFFTASTASSTAGTRIYVSILRRRCPGDGRWCCSSPLGLFATYSIFRLVPSSFVPDEDEGYFMAIVQAPAGRVARVHDRDRQAGREDPLRRSGHPGRVLGHGVSASPVAAPNNGMIFARLKNYEDRIGPAHRCRRCSIGCEDHCFGIPGAIVVAFAPPALQGLSIFGGFDFQVLDQTGNADINRLAGATFGLLGAGNQSGKVTGLFSSFRADDPQLLVDIDRDKARSLWPAASRGH
jgi:HAE1 family hydrophobic/amphiphilic exporter-1